MNTRLTAFCLTLILLVFTGQALALNTSGWCPSPVGMAQDSDHHAHRASHVASPECLPGNPDCHDQTDQAGLSGEAASDCDPACDCCPSAVSAVPMNRYPGEYRKPHFSADSGYRTAAVASPRESLYRPPIAR